MANFWVAILDFRGVSCVGSANIPASLRGCMDFNYGMMLFFLGGFHESRKKHITWIWPPVTVESEG